MRIKPFDPNKPDTYKAWDTAFTSGVSASTAAAIKMGKPPTYAQAQTAMGPDATEEMVAEVVVAMGEQWEAAEAEAYRYAVLTIDFTSAKGKSLLDTVTRKFAPSRTGIQLLKYLRVKYLANHSF